MTVQEMLALQKVFGFILSIDSQGVEIVSRLQICVSHIWKEIKEAEYARSIFHDPQ